MRILERTGLRGLTLLGGLLVIAALAAFVVSGSAEATHKGKDHGPTKDGGKGSDNSATVVMSGGLVTPLDSTDEALPQPVEVVNDNKNKLQLQAERDADGRPTFNVEIKLTATKANANKVTCTGDTELIAKLTNPERRRNFLLQVDNTSLGLPSGGQKGHTIKLSWGEPGVGGPFNLFILGAKVTGDDSGKTRVFEFTGGTVKVKDKTGPVKDHTELVCPNKDTISVEVMNLP